jgi:hypothetical protein
VYSHGMHSMIRPWASPSKPSAVVSPSFTHSRRRYSHLELFHDAEPETCVRLTFLNCAVTSLGRNSIGICSEQEFGFGSKSSADLRIPRDSPFFMSTLSRRSSSMRHWRLLTSNESSNSHPDSIDKPTQMQRMNAFISPLTRSISSTSSSSTWLLRVRTGGCGAFCISLWDDRSNKCNYCSYASP